jgi:transcriptional regulator with XRE-family HTH domain
MTQRRPWTYFERKRVLARHSLSSLAVAVGRNVSTIYRYEEGEICPPFEMFAPLAAELRCDARELMASFPHPSRELTIMLDADHNPDKTAEAVA